MIFCQLKKISYIFYLFKCIVLDEENHLNDEGNGQKTGNGSVCVISDAASGYLGNKFMLHFHGNSAVQFIFNQQRSDSQAT